MLNFSIIIPLYNVASCLRTCVASVCDSDCADLEVILVDDGSDDGACEICHEIMTGDGRVKYFRQEHQGVVAARQFGFEQSHGKWILFLDGDDSFAKNAIKVLHDVVQKTESEIIQFGFNRIDGDNCCQDKPKIKGCVRTEAVIEMAKRSPLDILKLCIWNKCYRRDVVRNAFDDVGDVKISHSEDGLFAFAAFLHATSVEFVDDCYYNYNYRENSASNILRSDIVDDKIKFVSKIEELARISHGMSNDQITRMVDFHGYEAACQIFLNLRRLNIPKVRRVKILSELAKSNFLSDANKEWRGMKRGLMRFLLRHAFLYEALRPVIA